MKQSSINAEAEFEDKAEAMRKELAIWEGYLAQSGGFITGPDFSLADVAAGALQILAST